MPDDPNVSIEKPGASNQDYVAAIAEYMRESANPVDAGGRLDRDATPQLRERNQRTGEIPNLGLWITTTIILVTLYIAMLALSG